ncbi:gluconeogenesis factor YvcK family protein [Furfurilactobacillus curtus]|uniref:Putative gluconeogenesis factor n=1 Tax=Furfurilactobacillus curtus TaxID=1746200 RepID=A0ABQ5JR18_9LACO
MTQANQRRPRVVVIGGGTGLPVVLDSLHKQDVDVTAVVTVADDGGSSGIIRNYINVVPPGDIRNVMVSLSSLSPLALRVFQYRFEANDNFFSGHAIGNLIIAALTEMEHGVFGAVQELSQMMAVDGHVYPVANEPLVLHAEFADGATVAGEAEITAAHRQIKRVWVTPQPDAGTTVATAMPAVVDAILAADLIVLGPGSLFTSILPNLMVSNVGQAIKTTTAEVVYICNIMTQKGETDHFTDADHVRVLNEHVGANFVDTVLVNTAKVPEDYMDWKRWNEVSTQVTSDPEALEKMGTKAIRANLLKLRDAGAFHDGAKVVAELMKLLKQKDLSEI